MKEVGDLLGFFLPGDLMYEYNATVTSVYDGDTITVDWDLGHAVWVKGAKLRLAGVNTPELRTKDLLEKEAARAARDYVRECVLGKTIRLKSLKKGKYGRYLSIIWVLDEDGEPLEESVNDALIRLGHAKPYMV